MSASTQGLDRIAIEIAPGASPAASADSFDWVSAGKRRTSADIVITGGRDDEESEVVAGSLSVTMDDRAGNLSPRNVLGTYYGSLGRGTPIRVRWARTTDNFTRTAVASGWGTSADGYAWTSSALTPTQIFTDGTRGVATLAFSNASRLLVTGGGSPDAEVSWSVTLPALPTGNVYVSAAVLRHTGSSNYLRAHVELEPAGTIALNIQRVTASGTDTVRSNVAAGTYTAGAKVRCKARADGPYVMVKAWLDSVAEPDGWPAVGTDTTCEGSGTGLFLWRLNTNVGTFTAYVDDFELANVIWSGNVPEWPPRWPNKSGADSIVPITGAGILRRLNQGRAAPLSPLRTQLGGLSYTGGYWPLEDAAGSTSAASGLAGGRAASVSGPVTFAGDDTLPGASTSLVLDTAVNSRVVGKANGKNTTGYAALALIKLKTLPSASRITMEILAIGTATRFVVYMTGTAFGFEGYDLNGNLIADAVGTYVVDPTKWTAVQLETGVSGGVVTVALIWHQVGSTDYYAISDTYSGTATRATGLAVFAPTDTTAVGHMWLGDDTLPFVADSFSKVSNGYFGEAAGDRMVRLASETSTPLAVMTGATETMGYQRPAALLDLLREGETADLGVLFERGNSLVYRPRSRRYNVPVTMALDWSLGHLDEPPEPEDDDQRLRNQWTVNRVNGSFATATQSTGPAGTDQVGVYDSQLDVNIELDDRLPDFANWLVTLGTVDKLRWPRIKINLIAHPELIPQWLACTIGSRITIANPPSQIAGEVIDLVIEGFTQNINVNRWTVELSCSPAQPWDVGVYSATTTRYDSLATTLTAARTANSTSLAITVTDPAQAWSSSAVPYDWRIAGEVVTVTAITAPVGTLTVTQTATVTRAVNGISKAQLAGAQVRLANPARYAL